MATLAVTTWIGNAAAVLTGPWGAVSQTARHAGCSRQVAYRHAQRVHQAVAQAHLGGPSPTQLLAQLQQLQQENQQLWQAWQESVPLDPDRQRRFSATPAALGLSLNQTRALLACVLPQPDCPSRATLGRWVQDAAARAGQVLGVLDGACAPLIHELCLDEIFCHRLPVLMGVEPHSLAWVLGQRAPDRSGASWQKALQAWPQLRHVIADNGTGLQGGLEAIAAQRRQRGGAAALEVSLDLFHTRREGEQALRGEWSAAERIGEEAEQAERALAQKRRRGQDGRAATRRALGAWRRAEQAFLAAQRREAAWRRAQQCLNLFGPDGRLNDPAAVQAQLQAALAELDGGRWAKLRRMLADRRSGTFRERLQRDLEAAEPRAELREALVELWRLRHASRPGCGPLAGGAAGVLLPAVQALLCGRLEPDWHGAYRRVARVLAGVVRASSVVECLNSIVRMHQARHRSLSQPLLDLKRLHWNGRVLAQGQRKEACPYQHLGLSLPTYDW
jgi:hypothetical protein